MLTNTAFKSINCKILRLKISLLSLSLEKSQKRKRPYYHKINARTQNFMELKAAMSITWTFCLGLKWILALNTFVVWQVIFYVKCWKKHYIRIHTLKDTTLCEGFSVLFVTLHTYCKELITELSQDRLP